MGSYRMKEELKYWLYLHITLDAKLSHLPKTLVSLSSQKMFYLFLWLATLKEENFAILAEIAKG